MQKPKISLWHVAIPVANLDESVSFYCHRLGFQLNGFDEYPDKKQAFIAVGDEGFNLELFEPKIKDREILGRKPDHLAFEVENLRSFRERLIQPGFSQLPEIEEFENGILHFKLSDPDGLTVQFFEGRRIYDEFLLSRRGAIDGGPH